MNPTTNLVTLSPELVSKVICSATIICCSGIVCFAIVGSIAMFRTQEGAAKSFGLMFCRIVPALAIILIVLAVFMLCLFGFIQGESALAALAGMGGAVLGSFADRVIGVGKEKSDD